MTPPNGPLASVGEGFAAEMNAARPGRFWRATSAGGGAVLVTEEDAALPPDRRPAVHVRGEGRDLVFTGALPLARPGEMPPCPPGALLNVVETYPAPPTGRGPEADAAGLRDVGRLAARVMAGRYLRFHAACLAQVAGEDALRPGCSATALAVSAGTGSPTAERESVALSPSGGRLDVHVLLPDAVRVGATLSPADAAALVDAHCSGGYVIGLTRSEFRALAAAVGDFVPSDPSMSPPLASVREKVRRAQGRRPPQESA